MRSPVVAVLSAVPLLTLLACGGSEPMQTSAPAADAVGTPVDLHDPALGRRGTYVERDLVSNGNVPAEHKDENLQNAWGLDALPTSPWWVADNGTGVSTLYDGEGIAQPTSPAPLVVSLPGVSGPAAPTGLVANTGDDFVITLGGVTGPARFLFASEDGTVSAWMRTDPISTTAVGVIDASPEGAIFKGLAVASTRAGSRLYATDFHNGVVRVYDGAFDEITKPGAFRDRKIPAGFGPFGIRVIHHVVLVTYAKQDENAEDDVKGAGFGFVDAFTEGGRLLARVASRGKLNAPWGLALAPAGFGPHSFRLLVGNFGDGRIVSFGLHRGEDRHERGEHRDDLDDDGAYLMGSNGPISIDGLWALSFGNGGPAGPPSTLFFTAGPNDENDGLFGRIDFNRAAHD